MTHLLAACPFVPDQPCHPLADPSLASAWPAWAATAVLALWLASQYARSRRKDPR